MPTTLVKRGLHDTIYDALIPRVASNLSNDYEDASETNSAADSAAKAIQAGQIAAVAVSVVAAIVIAAAAIVITVRHRHRSQVRQDVIEKHMSNASSVGSGDASGHPPSYRHGQGEEEEAGSWKTQSVYGSRYGTGHKHDVAVRGDTVRDSGVQVPPSAHV